MVMCDYAIAVRNLGFGGGPSWLWTVREASGVLYAGGIADSEDDAYAAAAQSLLPLPVDDDRPTGEW